MWLYRTKPMRKDAFVLEFYVWSNGPTHTCNVNVNVAQQICSSSNANKSFGLKFQYKTFCVFRFFLLAHGDRHTWHDTSTSNSRNIHTYPWHTVQDVSMVFHIKIQMIPVARTILVNSWISVIPWPIQSTMLTKMLLLWSPLLWHAYIDRKRNGK